MGKAHPEKPGHLFRRPEAWAQPHRHLGLVLCLRSAAPGGIPPSDLGKPGPGISGGLCFRGRELYPGGCRTGGARSLHPLSLPAVAGGKPVQPGAERQRSPLDADAHPEDGGLGGGTGFLPVPRDRGGGAGIYPPGIRSPGIPELDARPEAGQNRQLRGGVCRPVRGVEEGPVRAPPPSHPPHGGGAEERHPHGPGPPPAAGGAGAVRGHGVHPLYPAGRAPGGGPDG